MFRANKVNVVFLIVCLAVASLSFAATASAQSPSPYTYPYSASMCKLSTAVSSSNAGWVTPSGQNVGYFYGSQVTIRATANTGYQFDGWYINGIYQGQLSTITLTMLQDFYVYAQFSIRTSILTITTNPSYGGTTTPQSGMFNCSYNQQVTVYEYPAQGNTFAGWYLDGVYQGNGTQITVTMNQDRQLSAFFAGNGSVPTPQPTITPTPQPTQPPTNQTLLVPSLSYYCVSTTTNYGFNVRIQGALSYNQVPLSGAGIILSYSATGGATWHDLAYVITGDDGNFSAVWIPQASGNYVIRATWHGDMYYSNVTSLVNLAVAPNPQNQMFSISSNSTLSSLIFNSEANQLSFSVTGESGTYGYVEACIPKSLLPSAEALVVSLDGVTTPYTILSEGDNWLITIMYHHSTHSVVMALNSPTPTPGGGTSSSGGSGTNPTQSSATPIPATPELTPLVILPLLVVMLGLAIFVVLRRRTTTLTAPPAP